MDVVDLLLVSTLRLVGDMALCPVSLCFRRLEDGYFVISSATVYLNSAFLVTHVRQLNHPNPLVSASSRHMLIKYARRFSPHMPCLASHHESDPRRDDQSRCLRLWHELDGSCALYLVGPVRRPSARADRHPAEGDIGP